MDYFNKWWIYWGRFLSWQYEVWRSHTLPQFPIWPGPKSYDRILDLEAYWNCYNVSNTVSIIPINTACAKSGQNNVYRKQTEIACDELVENTSLWFSFAKSTKKYSSGAIERCEVDKPMRFMWPSPQNLFLNFGQGVMSHVRWQSKWLHHSQVITQPNHCT